MFFPYAKLEKTFFYYIYNVFLSAEMYHQQRFLRELSCMFRRKGIAYAHI